MATGLIDRNKSATANNEVRCYPTRFREQAPQDAIEEATMLRISIAATADSSDDGLPIASLPLLLDVTKAQREPNVDSHYMADDLARIAGIAVKLGTCDARNFIEARPATAT